MRLLTRGGGRCRYVSALAVSGVVWSLFHMPVLMLLSTKTRHKRPVLTVVVQLVNLAVAAFPVGCCTHARACDVVGVAAVCQRQLLPAPGVLAGLLVDHVTPVTRPQIGYIAIVSGYSAWPAAVMHFAWNRINPVLLGSIYSNTPGGRMGAGCVVTVLADDDKCRRCCVADRCAAGLLRGEQWKINGEGLAGIVVMVPLSCWLVSELAVAA